MRKGARSRSPVLLEGTSGCSPGITQATSAPAQSTSASDRLKGVPPSCSPSSLLCSKQQVFSSHGAHPPECSSSVDMVQGTAHLLSAQSDGRNCHLNSIAPAAQIEIAWILKRLCGPEMGCWVASEKHCCFLGIYIGINPLGPGVKSSPISIMDIQFTVYTVALLIVIFLVGRFHILGTVSNTWNAEQHNM